MGNKYGSRKTTVGAAVFDSKREAGRWRELQLMERAGVISGLKRQAPFALIPSTKTRTGKTVRGVKYIADFVYTDEHGRQVVEDAKGVRTDVYKIKAKLMLWLYGIEIREV